MHTELHENDKLRMSMQRIGMQASEYNLNYVISSTRAIRVGNALPTLMAWGDEIT